MAKDAVVAPRKGCLGGVGCGVEDVQTSEKNHLLLRSLQGKLWFVDAQERTGNGFALVQRKETSERGF